MTPSFGILIYGVNGLIFSNGDVNFENDPTLSHPSIESRASDLKKEQRQFSQLRQWKKEDLGGLRSANQQFKRPEMAINAPPKKAFSNLNRLVRRPRLSCSIFLSLSF